MEEERIQRLKLLLYEKIKEKGVYMGDNIWDFQY
jgi:hypothetical protein